MAKVASSNDIANALAKSTIPVKVKDKTNGSGLSPVDLEKLVVATPDKPKPKKRIRNQQCEFCKQKFKIVGVHEAECVMNPNRTVKGEIPCKKCGVGMASRAIKAHEKSCDGNAQTTIAKREKAIELKKRKLNAKLSGKPFVSNRGGNLKKKDKRSTPSSAAKSVNAQIEDALTSEQNDLDVLIGFMRERILNSDVTFKEFTAWENVTTLMWNKG
jgi:hypothetical protein